MFGYVVPEKSELKIREFETYSAYYCAVCHSIRERYGQLPRLLLTYDSAFLAMMLTSIDEREEDFSMFKCFTNPAKKRTVVDINDQIEYSADMMILLGYYNLKDDYDDEKSLLGLAGHKYLSRAYKKIDGKYPEKSSNIKKYLNTLKEVEKKNSRIFDEASEPFSLLMEEVFDYKGLGENKEQYRRIGFHLGKWIYLMDAYDDIEKDIKKKSYNPIINQFDYGKNGYENESIDDFKTRVNQRILLNLTLYLANIGEQAEKISIKKNENIIKNIIYLGLRNRTEQLINGTDNKEGKNN